MSTFSYTDLEFPRFKPRWQGTENSEGVTPQYFRIAASVIAYPQLISRS
jgi:hypothetical protein